MNILERSFDSESKKIVLELSKLNLSKIKGKKKKNTYESHKKLKLREETRKY